MAELREVSAEIEEEVSRLCVRWGIFRQWHRALCGLGHEIVQQEGISLTEISSPPLAKAFLFRLALICRYRWKRDEQLLVRSAQEESPEELKRLALDLLVTSVGTQAKEGDDSPSKKGQMKNIDSVEKDQLMRETEKMGKHSFRLVPLKSIGEMSAKDGTGDESPSPAGESRRADLGSEAPTPKGRERRALKKKVTVSEIKTVVQESIQKPPSSSSTKEKETKTPSSAAPIDSPGETPPSLSPSQVQSWTSLSFKQVMEAEDDILFRLLIERSPLCVGGEGNAEGVRDFRVDEGGGSFFALSKSPSEDTAAEKNTLSKSFSEETGVEKRSLKKVKGSTFLKTPSDSAKKTHLEPPSKTLKGKAKPHLPIKSRAEGDGKKSSGTADLSLPISEEEVLQTLAAVGDAFFSSDAVKKVEKRGMRVERITNALTKLVTLDPRVLFWLYPAFLAALGSRVSPQISSLTHHTAAAADEGGNLEQEGEAEDPVGQAAEETSKREDGEAPDELQVVVIDSTDGQQLQKKKGKRGKGPSPLCESEAEDEEEAAQRDLFLFEGGKEQEVEGKENTPSEGGSSSRFSRFQKDPVAMQKRFFDTTSQASFVMAKWIEEEEDEEDEEEVEGKREIEEGGDAPFGQLVDSEEDSQDGESSGVNGKEWALEVAPVSGAGGEKKEDGDVAKEESSSSDHQVDMNPSHVDGPETLPPPDQTPTKTFEEALTADRKDADRKERKKKKKQTETEEDQFGESRRRSHSREVAKERGKVEERGEAERHQRSRRHGRERRNDERERERGSVRERERGRGREGSRSRSRLFGERETSDGEKDREREKIAETGDEIAKQRFRGEQIERSRSRDERRAQHQDNRDRQRGKDRDRGRDDERERETEWNRDRGRERDRDRRRQEVDDDIVRSREQEEGKERRDTQEKEGVGIVRGRSHDRGKEGREETRRQRSRTREGRESRSRDERKENADDSRGENDKEGERSSSRVHRSAEEREWDRGRSRDGGESDKIRDTSRRREGRDRDGDGGRHRSSRSHRDGAGQAREENHQIDRESRRTGGHSESRERHRSRRSHQFRSASQQRQMDSAALEKAAPQQDTWPSKSAKTESDSAPHQATEPSHTETEQKRDGQNDKGGESTYMGYLSKMFG
uniref:Uncharacterized protein n=1 Tax=Chromera velia CCMP2878 TaxID=1169474 RepID=A0A0G4I1W0_9ALVE|eukprot:Cvel_10204.t1-p1 / transcript=Cvel_10204.t1 / gene=Cvel_10204 / organism=Chromera_velia_CCMP2878 / gene_product=hypothetical protein / transcript_product=hypothetical protein / location=Cvel_scaffold610:70663-75140(-) / protein_length=1141 / sequence_SO=supercontig / SO=protein_coding / is_pseudo=false